MALVTVLGEQARAYLIRHSGQREAVLIDAGCSLIELDEACRREGVTVATVLLTHGHLGHAFRAADIQRHFGAEVAAHIEELPNLMRLPAYADKAGRCGVRVPRIGRYLREGEKVHIGSLKVDVIETPGHSAGSLCFRTSGWIFVGDLMTEEGLRPAIAPGADPGMLRKSFRRIREALSPAITVAPGHGNPFDAARLSPE